jgi:hypothetical protein
MSVSLNVNSACIIIASHISNSKRIGHLMECLKSLLNQTLVIPIYLTISFENPELRNEFAIEYSSNKHLHSNILFILIKQVKTPQMRHMEELLPYLQGNHEWIMFCDDDDTYEPDRVNVFLTTIVNAMKELVNMPDNRLAGLYENIDNANHREKRQEYWCYCIHISLLINFMNKIRQYPDILNHKCCDIIFGEYLRRIDLKNLYICVNKHLYNYRVDNNSDSITGVIKNQGKVVRKPREVTNENMVECAKELNDYLNIDNSIYIHDTFLRTVVGSDFDSILRYEFLSEYPILGMIDQRHIRQMAEYHNYLKEVVNTLYDIKI